MLPGHSVPRFRCASSSLPAYDVAGRSRRPFSARSLRWAGLRSSQSLLTSAPYARSLRPANAAVGLGRMRVSPSMRVRRVASCHRLRHAATSMSRLLMNHWPGWRHRAEDCGTTPVVASAPTKFTTELADVGIQRECDGHPGRQRETAAYPLRLKPETRADPREAVPKPVA